MHSLQFILINRTPITSNPFAHSAADDPPEPLFVHPAASSASLPMVLDLSPGLFHTGELKHFRSPDALQLHLLSE